MRQMLSKLACSLGVIVMFTVQAAAQDTVASFDPRFQFREGIYLDIDDFRKNRPGVSFASLCDKDGKAVSDLAVGKKNFVKTKDGQVTPLLSKDIFGYAHRGVFYVRVDYGGEAYFDRLVVIGSISHFVCEIKNYYYDPYTATQPTRLLQQYMLDYETGQIIPFTIETFESILQRDSGLYKEYEALSKKKRKQVMFLYLRKYNEKHPVYFPM